MCADCVSYKHNKHNFEPIEKIIPEKLNELEGAEARCSKDLTLCRAKVNEFQISETKFESLCDESITTIKKDHRFDRINTSFLSYVLYTEYCPLLFSVVHLEIAI
jgi:hypothetical protein